MNDFVLKLAPAWAPHAAFFALMAAFALTPFLPSDFERPHGRWEVAVVSVTSVFRRKDALGAAACAVAAIVGAAVFCLAIPAINQVL